MSLAFKDLNSSVVRAHYAVRGPIVARAMELERQGREIIYCNIGNPQSLGQKPLTYLRQLLSLCIYPERSKDGIPSDIVGQAAKILKASQHGLGAYSESQGLLFIREAIAEFIEKRDGGGVDPKNIFLTDGASKGVESVLDLLIASSADGVMIPIPQYPLYSATIARRNGVAVPYFLDEENNWSLSESALEETLKQAAAKGVKTKALCVINPGNPTGAVLDEENIRTILAFAQRHGLAILADEVYQEDLHVEGKKFVSFAKVLRETGTTDVSLFSFHSGSKGYYGECGFRAGYFVCQNVTEDVRHQILKLQSIGLCSNLAGQVVMYSVVRPPKQGEPSFALYMKERQEILDSLKERAGCLVEGLNKIPGYSCNRIEGALYGFPKIDLPKGVTDDDYCLKLLEKTGVCVVPGSGFGQREGTSHFRITILPPPDKIREVVKLISEFHRSGDWS